jgi:hypothetical protein
MGTVEKELQLRGEDLNDRFDYDPAGTVGRVVSGPTTDDADGRSDRA